MSFRKKVKGLNLPEVLKFGTCRHDRTLSRSAVLCDGSIEDIDLIKEIDEIDSQPLKNGINSQWKEK